MLNKLLRYGWKTAIWIVGVLVALWLIFLAYVWLNEKALIGKLSSAIQEKTRGEVQIGSLSVSLIRTFPILSLQLNNVVVRDSVYALHQKDFFKAGNVYLRLSITGLISGNSPVGKVIVRNGEINILTDSTGYSNEYILKQEKKDPQKKASLPVIEFRNMTLSYLNPLKNKFHQAQIREMEAKVKEDEQQKMTVALKIKMLVRSLAFNTNKGSFLKEKTLDGDFKLYLDKKKNDLLVQNVRMDIDKHPFYFNGKFHIDKVSPDFDLTISTFKIDFTRAVSLLSDTLQNKLNAFAFKMPIDLSVQLKGKTLYKYVPAARIITNLELNSVDNFGSTAFELIKGKAAVNLLFNGPVGRGDSLVDGIDGKIRITGADVKYIPRNFLLKELNGSLQFNSEDLIVDTFVAYAGQTKLMMKGIAKKFVSMLNKEPEKMEMQWDIFSPKLGLDDFKPFLSYEGTGSSGKNKKSSGAISRVDKIFSEGDVYIGLRTPQMDYKTFHASNVKANVILKSSEIVLEKVFFQHAKGTMEMAGTMKNGTDLNPVQLRTRMQNMDIPMLFEAFDNFGQDALTYKNLKGTLHAEVLLNTAISNKAKLVTGSSEGTVDFLLENGELNHFEPVQEIAKKVFKKQDFSEIRFADLQNRLNIAGTSFIVNPMEIRSTALTFFVEGVFDMKKGTDMGIQLPLRNLLKSQSNTDLSDETRAKKGVTLRLRAKTGDDGKLKVSWDPFRKSVKNKEAVKDSAEVKE